MDFPGLSVRAELFQIFGQRLLNTRIYIVVVWKNHFRKFRKIIDAYENSPRSVQTKCLFEQKFFPHTKLDSIFNRFIVSLQLINLFAILENNIQIQCFT